MLDPHAIQYFDFLSIKKRSLYHLCRPVQLFKKVFKEMKKKIISLYPGIRC